MAHQAHGEYHEEEVLRRYLWKNYAHALPEHERALHTAIVLELKARQASSPALAARLRGRTRRFPSVDVPALADAGLEAFEAKCADALLRDDEEEIVINRCAQCSRIVASPVACVCRWCGHHWHERRAQMIADARSSIYPKPKG